MAPDEDGDGGRRHSKALSAEIIQDPHERAKAEARNGLRQFDEAVEIIDYFLDPQRPFRLRPSQILHLQRTALEGISAYAGNYRPGHVDIEKSKHKPPPAHRVAELVEDMCDYVNENWASSSAVHLAAYVMWRLNWIHPFADGNGRTSRTISYVVLCVRLGYRVPGNRVIPLQISEDRRPYFQALDAADEAAARGEFDVSQMEELVAQLLAEQLYSVFEDATGDLGSSE